MRSKSGPGPLSGFEIEEKLTVLFPELTYLTDSVYVVGGGIRDLLLGRTPADLDVVCREAREVATRFAADARGRLVDLGREKFVTFRVVCKGRMFDFTTLTGDSIEEDLSRRDFTVNALALQLRMAELIDPLGGQKDVATRTVRMVCEDNLRTDPLRILKAVRMAVILDFSIDSNTTVALSRHRVLLQGVAPERLSSELRLILASPSRGRGGQLMRDTGIDSVLFERSLEAQELLALERLNSSDPLTAFAILFRNVTESRMREVLRHWRWSERDTRDLIKTVRLVQFFEGGNIRDPRGVSMALHDARATAALRSLEVLAALERFAELALVRQLMESRSHEIFESVAFLDGTEIEGLTGRSGRSVGLMKRVLLEEQILGNITSRNEAIDFVTKRSRE